MGRSEKEEILNCYCDSIDDCDNCELMKKYDKDTNEFTDQYFCIFEDMSDDMLNKCYDWYKEISPAACENAEGDCCKKEPDVDMVNHPSHYTQGDIECMLSKPQLLVRLALMQYAQPMLLNISGDMKKKMELRMLKKQDGILID